MSTLASILACHLRAESHETLARSLASLALAMEDILHNRVDSAVETAEAALRNTGILAIQELTENKS